MLLDGKNGARFEASRRLHDEAMMKRDDLLHERGDFVVRFVGELLRQIAAEAVTLWPLGELAEAHAELERRTNQLESLQDQLRDQAERDWLTGLHNRRYLARELERLAQERRSLPLSLAILDLDHFKSINDRFGHEAGDQVLIRVARLLCDVLRASDTVVRSGGEEFVILMPSTDDGAATACCERIRAAIRAEAWGTVAAGLDVSASVGVAGTEDPDDLEALIRLADQRLYDAKRTGRDRVVGPPERLSAV